MISKRIILSGDNLLDAQPRMNNETNEIVMSNETIAKARISVERMNAVGR